jgi:hypothetical protein
MYKTIIELLSALIHVLYTDNYANKTKAKRKLKDENKLTDVPLLWTRRYTIVMNPNSCFC